VTDPRPSSGGITITLLPPQLVALIGGVLVFVGPWLDWFRPDREIGSPFGLNAYDVPAKFLFRDSGIFLNRGGPALGFLIALVGLACIAAALARPMTVLALPAGAVAFVIAVWYALRLRDFVDPFGDFGPGFGDALGLGTIVVAIGGIVATVGGILSLTSRPAVASPPSGESV
jgi:hypothetical protein